MKLRNRCFALGGAMAQLAGICCATFAGCGAKEPDTYPATIKVAYPNGKPVTGAHVVLRSEDTKLSARGSTGSDGSCRLTTFKSGDGAVLGRHSVIVAEPPLMGDPDVPYSGPQIADKFSSFATSGLEITVGRDKEKNVFTLTVTPP